MGFSTGGGSDDQGMMSEINVTPFVDVMLVLLIIFMVTAPLMTIGTPVELPRQDAPPLPVDSDDQLILSLTADGKYYINEQEIPAGEMGPKLQAISAAKPDQAVFLRADGAVPYEKVAQLMAMCQQAGFARLGMVTQPGDQP